MQPAGIALATLPVAVIKYLSRSNQPLPGKEGIIDGPHGEKAWWKEWVAPGHNASAAEKLGIMNAGAQLPFSILFRPQPLRWCCPHSGWVFPSQLT